MPDTPRGILQLKIADALTASHERCIAASASMANGDTHVDESRKAIDRTRALLLRAAEGTRLAWLNSARHIVDKVAFGGQLWCHLPFR